MTAAIVAYFEKAVLGSVDLEPKLALRLIILAAGFGVLADALFHRAGLGINIAIWYGALFAAILRVLQVGEPRLRRGHMAVLAASLGLTALAAWRGSDTLTALNLFGVSGLLIVGLAPVPGRSLRAVDILELSLALAYALVSIAIGAPRLLAAGPWPERLDSGARQQVLALGWGVFLAVPLVLLFGGLFMASDAVFESKLKDVVSVDLVTVPVHVWWFTAGSWLAAGVLWLACTAKAAEPPEVQIPDSWRLKTIATGIILGSLLLLFAAFVAVQVHYLFGGQNVVLQSIHLTYAQYARRGFFELVAASALLLPVLVGVNWARSRSKASRLVFQSLAIALIGLLFAVMASALQRLHVYTDAYGLTELRLYAVCILVWLGGVFSWFAWTVIRAQPGQFVAGALLAAIVAVVGLNVANPDVIIAQTNTDRIRSARPFDARHASSLGPDAVPLLVTRLGRLSNEDACVIARNLQSEWRGRSTDPRSWNWSRARAQKAVTDHRAELQAACP